MKKLIWPRKTCTWKVRQFKKYKEQDWITLPESAQQEVYDFFVSIKQHYDKQTQQKRSDESETLAFSNHSAN